MVVLLLQSSYSTLIDWLTTYAVEVNAVVSLFLTLAIIGVYLKQHRELKSQTRSMENQTEAIRAGIKPILQIDGFDALETHPIEDREISNADYADVDLSNVGNETAKNIQLLTHLHIESDLPDTTFTTVEYPLNLQARPIVAREGEGGVLPAEGTKSFYAPVEVGIHHPKIQDDQLRLPNALSTLGELIDNDQLANPCLEVGIRYENLAEETTTLPIKDGIEIDLSADHASFKTILDNREGTCEGTEKFDRST